MADVGRPLKFETVEILQKAIDKYFNETPKDEWTITGLALALDTYRSVLCDYENLDRRKEYSNTIKRAKLKVENGYEIDLKKHGRTGTIFALKNFDWKDKNEVDLSTLGEKINGFNYIIPNDANDKTLTKTTPGLEQTTGQDD
jgi:hypothetical protein